MPNFHSPRVMGEPLILHDKRDQFHYYDAKSISGLDTLYDRATGKPILGVRHVSGYHFVTIGSEDGLQAESETLKTLLEWFGLPEEHQRRIYAWLGSEPGPHPVEFLNFRHTETGSVMSVPVRDLGMIEPTTYAGRKAISVLVNGPVLATPLYACREHVAAIRFLAKWRGVDPQVWLTWVGYEDPEATDDAEAVPAEDTDAREEAA